MKVYLQYEETFITYNHSGDEFISYFPEWKDLYTHLKMRYEDLVSNIEKEYEKIQNDETLKDMNKFAKHISKFSPIWKTALFQLRKNQQSIRKYLATTAIKNLEKELPNEDINTLPVKLQEQLKEVEENESAQE